jgi:hypothetical protein
MMRRIDVILLGIGVAIAGWLIYLGLQATGLDKINAGIWSQVIFTVGLLGWASTYLLRVFTKKMTYNQQLQDYEDAVLQKRLEELTPEELAQLQAEVEAERQKISES